MNWVLGVLGGRSQRTRRFKILFLEVCEKSYNAEGLRVPPRKQCSVFTFANTPCMIA